MRELHVTLALLSVSGFLLRLGWCYTAPDMLQQKWVRIAPHVIDTCLLLAGVGLVLALPEGSATGWLWVKFGVLVGYIGFGVLALRGSGTLRVVGAVGALSAATYLFVVAFTRQAWPF